MVPRDRHAELLQAIALAGAGLERLATEVRHLQRTEVREAEEPFRAGQKGSSAMPHKRNPITSERITGLARVLRGNASAAVENVALWHERDISHSGAERVILPDSTILLDYLQHLPCAWSTGWWWHADRMRENLGLTHGALFSQRVLLALVERGMQRDDAYRIVQEDAQRAWDTATPLRELLAAREPGPGPRRHLRPRLLHAPRARGHRPPRRHRAVHGTAGSRPRSLSAGPDAPRSTSPWPVDTASSGRECARHVRLRDRRRGLGGLRARQRLSEDPDVQVLLLEAGPPDTADFIHIPAAFSALFRSQNDWDLGTGYEPGSTIAASTCRAARRSAARRR